MKKLIIAGGTGFLGKACIVHFKNQFDKIIVLTRGQQHISENVQYVQWDAKTLSDWHYFMEGSDVLINLVGRSVDCRYTPKNKELILKTRVDSTKVLGSAISRIKNPPKIWLNASTATIYRHSLHRGMSEFNGEIGAGFSVNVAKAWENAFFGQNTPKTRKVALRTSIVLGKQGGAFPPLQKLAQLGFGGKQGNGNQKFSWIHIQDFVRSIDHIIHNECLEGVINITAPIPATNRELMKTLRKIQQVPFGIPLPRWLLQIGARIIRTETELILKSRNIIPKKLISNGFVYCFPTLKMATKNCS